MSKVVSKRSGEAASEGSSKKVRAATRPEFRCKISKPLCVTSGGSVDQQQDTYNYDFEDTYDWHDFLARPSPDFDTPPVNAFLHAPMSECWSPFSAAGVKVEVPSPGLTTDRVAPNWMAKIQRFAGYKVLLRYELMEDSSHDFWSNLLCSDIAPVGYSADKGIPLIPPKIVLDGNVEFQSDEKLMRSTLVRKITGCRSLPANFQEIVIDSLKSKFKERMLVEVVDRNRLSRIRPAMVTQVIGTRLKIAYGENDDEVALEAAYSAKKNKDSDDDGDSNQFWVHERSPLLHYVGWAEKIGHVISASAAYRSRCKTLIRESGTYDVNEAVPDMFYEPPVLENDALLKFSPGQKLEARDPLDLSNIVVATVDKVLEKGYMMVKFDGTNDTFCYHKSSPYIFPVMFCHEMDIKLTPPVGTRRSSNDDEPFKWVDYLRQSKASAAPVALFHQEIVRHRFHKGQKLEVTDLMDPKLICVATVRDVKGRLLRIHFDGWDDHFDQWIDCTSPDLYPIGYCEAVGYKLEAPKEPETATAASASTSAQKKQRTNSGPKTNPQGRKKKNKNLSSDGASTSALNDELPDSIMIPPSFAHLPARSWTAQHVQTFFEANQLDDLPKKFLDQKISGSVLLTLNEDKLKAEGVKANKMSSMLRLIATLKSKYNLVE